VKTKAPWSTRFRITSSKRSGRHRDGERRAAVTHNGDNSDSNSRFWHPALSPALHIISAISPAIDQTRRRFWQSNNAGCSRPTAVGGFSLVWPDRRRKTSGPASGNGWNGVTGAIRSSGRYLPGRPTPPPQLLSLARNRSTRIGRLRTVTSQFHTGRRSCPW
jgi:hypothetical protein